MAIIIEPERQNRFGALGLLAWIVAIAVIIAAVYYVFFRRPELIDVALPSGLQGSREILNVNVDPDLLISGPLRFRRQHVPEPTPRNLGRANPFLPF